nr:MAG TPA: hypothetical protein [Caudoviricetes sp.]
MFCNKNILNYTILRYFFTALYPFVFRFVTKICY